MRRRLLFLLSLFLWFLDSSTSLGMTIIKLNYVRGMPDRVGHDDGKVRHDEGKAGDPRSGRG